MKAAREYFVDQFDPIAPRIEARGPLLFGDRISAADILLTTASTGRSASASRSRRRPRRYHGRLTARPAYRRAWQKNVPPATLSGPSGRHGAKTMPGPLAGVKVLRPSSVVSGPLATMHLADQGAEVIKLEPPAGDISRRSRRKVSANGEFSALFISVNRGKRSIALDLKSPKSARDRAGSSPCGRTCWCRTSARARWNASGSAKRRFARPTRGSSTFRSAASATRAPTPSKRIYDPMIQGLSGLADIQSHPETGRPQMIRTILADKTTSIFTAQAVTAALYAREKTGEGQHVRISLLDTMVAYLWPEGMMPYTVVDLDPSAISTNSGPDLIFQTKDGFITVGTISDSEWQGFCDAVGRPELKTDERFADRRAAVPQLDRADHISWARS